MTRWRFKLLLLVLIGIVITVFFIHPSHGAHNHSPPQSDINYKKTVLTVGYLTAIKGEMKDKQGLAISGALKMALDEVQLPIFYSSLLFIVLNFVYPSSIQCVELLLFNSFF